MLDPDDPQEATWAATGPVATWLGKLPAEFGSMPEGADASRAAWLRSVFRFSRADGSAVFGPPGRDPARLAALERQVRAVGDPQLARVVGWWRPARRAGLRDNGDEGWASPPLPTEGWLDRPLAILRPSWTARGDRLAVDHRVAGLRSLVEVAGRGGTWLGPTWDSPGLPGEVGPARTTYWSAGAYADAFEWSFRAGPVEVTRTAVLVRNGHLALLMQTERGVGPGVSEVRWGLAEGVAARPDPRLRTLVLSAGAGRPAARLVPLGLPESNYSTDRGALVAEGREIVLRQRTEGENRCLALLVSWRKQPPRDWRALTVAERSATCPPGTAFAARVGWGVSQNSLFVYRSLGPAGLRSVLGHQTKARLVVGAFGPTGDVRPWIKVAADDPVPG